jgi:hypothetical protein
MKKIIPQFKKVDCTVPSIAYKISEDLNNAKDIFLVVISTEDEPSKNTYLHSDILPVVMKEKNFYKLKSYKISKVGKDSNNASRMSIYAHNDLKNDFVLEEKEIKLNFHNDGVFGKRKDDEGRHLGAIVALVWHPNFGRFAFTNVNLPTRDRSFVSYDEYKRYRAYLATSNASFLNTLVSKLNTIKKYKKPEYIIITGNLNFDIVPKDELKLKSFISKLESDEGFRISDLREMHQYDELRKGIDYGFYLIKFLEGESNSGPLFLPTGPLKQNRPESCSPKKSEMMKLPKGCFVNNGEMTLLGWRERIIYNELEDSDSGYMMHCVDYDRIDIGEMNKGHNAGVYSLFQLLPRNKRLD